MQLAGTNWIGGRGSADAAATLRGVNPATGEALAPVFVEATFGRPDGELERAAQVAEQAAALLRRLSGEQVRTLLLTIAEELTAVKEELVARAMLETGLPRPRLEGEHGRTVNQVRLFAEVAREGSWVDARISVALPDRQPLPRPDLRRMLVPLGPVAVFGASNFPLAFSVAGGDTASALAARNPVIVKGHPAHPGTSEIAARAIVQALERCQAPAGAFALLQGSDPELSVALVRHPAIQAVGFTGSGRAGRALMQAAAARPQPIPVYAEMGSVNPVFVLPGALAGRGPAIAQGLRDSVLLGAGQFCTCPGLVFHQEGEAAAGWRRELRQHFAEAPAQTMLHRGIAQAYTQEAERRAELRGVTATVAASAAGVSQTRPLLLEAAVEPFLATPDLQEELFGPATVVVSCQDRAQMLAAARALDGSLTATVHGTAEELREYSDLIEVLTEKAGRVIFNGYPTGVEVDAAMQHGGPWPSTSDAKFTSVGTAAILRFARPVCYQNFPQAALPAELQDSNPTGIWRWVEGTWTKAAIPH